MLADTVILIVTKSHQLNDMTFDESLDSQYGNDIAYCEQPPESDCDNHWCNKEHILLMMTLLFFCQCDDTRPHAQITVKTHTEVGFKI